MKGLADSHVRLFHSTKFCLRPGDEPELARASGDSGFVAHLAASTHGATGWDWSFRLVRPGHGWAFVSDGRLSLFLDEPNQYVPKEAKPGDLVAVRMPRARENLHPHRFALYGGQGGPVLGPAFVKLFVPVRYDFAGSLVALFSGRGADQLRFGLSLANSPLDFERADAAVIDVSAQDEPGVLRLLETFTETSPRAVRARDQLPWGTKPGPLGLGRAEALGRTDVADGYGWRRSQEAVSLGKEPL